MNFDNDLEISYSDLSCGINELTGVNGTGPEAFKMIVAGNMQSAGGDYRHLRRGFTYVFSDNSAGNGKHIANLIRRYKLGRLVSTNWTINPSSRNRIKTWTWIYNGKIPSAWAKIKIPDNYNSGDVR